MRPQLLMGAVGVFIFGTLLCCLCSGRWLLDGEVNIINALASFNVMTVDGGGAFTVPKGIAAYWSAIMTALTWNYPFLGSPWALFIKVPLWIVSIGVIWGLLEAAASILQGVAGFFRSLVP